MKIGFIGAGNMAGAIIKGALNSGYDANDLFAFDIDRKKIDDLGINACNSACELVENCDITFFAVKPYIIESVLEQIKGISANRAFVSIVAAWSTEKLLGYLPEARILRVMPNTPLMVGEGAVALSAQNNLTEEELAFAEKFLSSQGFVFTVKEDLMNAVTGLSGSGPAYVYVFIEALADAGVMQGLPRDLAYKLAAQTVKGAAEMVLKTGEHPGALKDAVTSPAGTTICGIFELEKAGFRAAAIKAVNASADKSRELS